MKKNNVLGYFWNTSPKNYLCFFELKEIDGFKYVDMMGRKWNHFSRVNPINFSDEQFELLKNLNFIDLEVKGYRYKKLFNKI